MSKALKFAYGKMWGGIVALIVVFTFVIVVPRTLSYIGETLGVHSELGGILSLIVLFGWLAALIILPIYTAKKMKYVGPPH